jgi:vacuolar protein sorting-associated protein 35
VNLEVYQTIVLPKLLEMIKSSKDALAQQYLLDCMIQGFPEEFHIHTLPEVLNLCANELEKQVDVKLVFIGLMERLADYASSASEVTETIKEKVNLYELFKKNIDTLIENSDASDFKNVLYLETAFLKFTIRCYPTQAEYVNEILKSAVRSCSLHTSHMDEECQSYIVKILTLPLDSLSVAVLTMDEYPNLMKHLKFARRREVAQQIAKIVTKNNLQLAD